MAALKEKRLSENVMASPRADKLQKVAPGTAPRDRGTGGHTADEGTDATPGAYETNAAAAMLGGYEHNSDGTVTGFIFGSKSFRDGESITTSKVASCTTTHVETESGSRYALGVRAPAPAEAPSGPTTVAVVGNGDCGQLGFGPDLLEATKPKRCPFFEGRRVLSLACGGMHTAACGADGECWTWGCNDDGALGRLGDEDTPLPVSGGALASERVTAVACGDSVTTVLCASGRVCSWGTYKDSGGTLGFCEGVRVQLEPIALELPTVRLVACGANHSLAVTMRGTLYAWGCGEQGQLGARLLASRPRAKLAPTKPLPLRRGRAALPVVSAAAGAYHSLAVTADGEARRRMERRRPREPMVWAWGLNNHGQLGLGDTAPRTAPAPVAGLKGLQVEAAAGGEHHSLVRTAAGEVWGFGRGDSHQLGLGEGAAAQVLTPARVPGVADAAQLVCGSNHACAVTRAGDLYTWGFGEMYQCALPVRNAVLGREEAIT